MLARQQEAAETPSRPSSLLSAEEVSGWEKRRYTQGGLELQLRGSCLKGDQAGFWGSPLPGEGGDLV